MGIKIFVKFIYNKCTKNLKEFIFKIYFYLENVVVLAVITLIYFYVRFLDFLNNTKDLLLKRNTSFYLFFFKIKKKIKSKKEKTLTILKINKALSYKSLINLLYRRQKGKYYSAYYSFWPIMLSFFLGGFLLFFTFILHSEIYSKYLNIYLLISFFSLLIAIVFWISMFYVEKKMGNHTLEVRMNIQLAFYIFIFTEAVCFLALFWLFLHSFLAPGIFIGTHNPGEGVINYLISESTFYKSFDSNSVKPTINILNPLNTDNSLFVTCEFSDWYKTNYINLQSAEKLYDSVILESTGRRRNKIHFNFIQAGLLINPYKIPLMNTLILLVSAGFLNAGHCALKLSKFKTCFKFLVITIIFGLLFISIQYYEYKMAALQFNDGIFASCFYSLTGLHGIHVIIGVFMLFFSAINLYRNDLTKNYHQSFYFSIFYWHFVDIIWIFVFFVIYLWPARFYYKSDFEFKIISENESINFFSYKLNTDHFIEAFLNNINCFGCHTSYKFKLFSALFMFENSSKIVNDTYPKVGGKYCDFFWNYPNYTELHPASNNYQHSRENAPELLNFVNYAFVTGFAKVNEWTKLAYYSGLNIEEFYHKYQEPFGDAVDYRKEVIINEELMGLFGYSMEAHSWLKVLYWDKYFKFQNFDFDIYFYFVSCEEWLLMRVLKEAIYLTFDGIIFYLQDINYNDFKKKKYAFDFFLDAMNLYTTLLLDDYYFNIKKKTK